MNELRKKHFENSLYLVSLDLKFQFRVQNKARDPKMSELHKSFPKILYLHHLLPLGLKISCPEDGGQKFVVRKNSRKFSVPPLCWELICMPPDQNMIPH